MNGILWPYSSVIGIDAREVAAPSAGYAVKDLEWKELRDNGRIVGVHAVACGAKARYSVNSNVRSEGTLRGWKEITCTFRF